MNFTDLGLLPIIVKALERQGYKAPTPIQAGAIPPALKGRDVLGLAQTGTGKTCAFATPILQRLSTSPRKGPRVIRALIVTPTRELALQIQENIVAYGVGLPLRSAVIFGGVGQQPQVDAIRRGLDILVATPGRLLDLHGQGLLDLSQVELFVLDEADRMLDMGFIHDVRRILKLVPQKKQTFFFSATMPPEVTELVDSLLHDPVRVEVTPVSSPVEVIEQSLYFVDKGNKTKLLADLVRRPEVKNALVFSRTKHGANKIAQDLNKRGIAAAAIHGNKSQTARVAALTDFKAGKVKVLVATDIAARGLDIEDLSHVFNYNLPDVPETYVHRIGRTGRAGRGGVAISFCEAGEKSDLKAIEKLLGRSIPVVAHHDYPMEIFEAPVKAQPTARQKGTKKPAAPQPKAVKPPKAQEEKPKQPKPPKAKAQEPKKETAQKAQKPQKTQKAPVPKTERKAAQPKAAPPAPVEPQAWRRPDPLGDDRIMDATARLLAPKKPTAPPAAPQPKTERQAKQKNKPGRKKAGSRPEEAPSAPTAGNKPKGKGRTEQDRRQNRRGRGTPPEVQLRSGGQKDSTEQESLMKPYYLND